LAFRKKVTKEGKTDSCAAGQMPSFYETKLFIRKDVSLVLGRGQLNPVCTFLLCFSKDPF
jgi:hypothetical protein